MPAVRQKKTARGFSSLSLTEQIQRAQSMAREILLEDGIEVDPHPQRTTITARVGELLGDASLSGGCADLTEAQLSLLSDRLQAAQALGIALGLLLRPEVLADGAR